MLIQNENIDVYGDDVEVDYRGYEVTVENFVRLLTGRLPDDTPRYAFSFLLIFFFGGGRVEKFGPLIKPATVSVRNPNLSEI